MAEPEFSNKSSLIRRGGICIFVDEEEAETIEQRPRGITFAPVPSPLPKCPLCGADISTTTVNANAGTTTNGTTDTTAIGTATTATASSKRSSHAPDPAPDLGQGSTSSFWHKRTAAVTACWQQSKNRKRRFKTGCSHCGATGESCRIPHPLSSTFFLALSALCLSQLQHLPHASCPTPLNPFHKYFRVMSICIILPLWSYIFIISHPTETFLTIYFLNY